jgi:flagellar motor switch protein FliG
MSRMKQLPASVIEDVASALAAQLPDADATALVSVDGVAKAAELLNASSKAASTQILAKLELEDPELAAMVRQAMFTFDDLARLDVRAMRTLLREVATDRLTIALRGAPQAVVDAIFSGLSSRAADLIRDDLANMGHVRKADVEAARREITDTAIKLEEEGKLSLGREEE